MNNITQPRVGAIMSGPVFRTARGHLTAYALACGYIESFEIAGRHVSAGRDGCFFVKHYDHGQANRAGTGRVYWECPRTLTEMRREFARQKRAAIATSKVQS